MTYENYYVERLLGASRYSPLRKKIIRMVLLGCPSCERTYSVSEAAKACGVTRQYAHKVVQELKRRYSRIDLTPRSRSTTGASTSPSSPG